MWQITAKQQSVVGQSANNGATLYACEWLAAVQGIDFGR